ncbi:MAG TPA: ergothioneine biosynthesis protein EgtC [Acidimicrobiales bacterium]|nr:ergothioneine biosynthesis protein EgtC [Acidimicrobiales bacterium]
MCRLFAYLGPSATLEQLVLSPPHSLLRQCWEPRSQVGGVVNADGFGVGWYDLSRRPEPARYRSTLPMWADRSFASLAGIVSSTAVLAAVRSATPPLPTERSSTPPFTAGPWLFAHNGAVAGFREGAGSRLRRLLSERREAGIEGSSDSEVLFALTLDQLDSGEAPAEALTHVVDTVSAAAGGRLNLLLTDGGSIWATSRGDSLVARTTSDSVVVASEPDDDEAEWQTIPDGAMVSAAPGQVDWRPR